MNDLKIDVKKYANTHTYCEHVCGYASGSLFYFPRLKAVYHTSGYLIAENIANMLAFSEFCNAFELGSEISVNPLYRPALIEDLLKQQKETKENHARRNT
nr:MAG TPA: hypothetical protein [Caudoviricetes sp.]